MDKSSISPCHQTKNHEEEEQKNIITPNTIKSTLIFSQHYRVSIMVALICLATIGILSYGGYLLDQYFGTSYIFFVIGLFLSFPISQYILYQWIKKRYVPFVKTLK